MARGQRTRSGATPTRRTTSGAAVHAPGSGVAGGAAGGASAGAATPSGNAISGVVSDARVARLAQPGERVGAHRLYHYVGGSSRKEYHGLLFHDPQSGEYRGVCAWGRIGAQNLQKVVYYAGPDMHAAISAVNTKVDEKLRKGYVVADGLRHGGIDASQVSTGAASYATAPTNTRPPAIVGLAAVGETLSADIGDWRDLGDCRLEWRRTQGAGSVAIADTLDVSVTRSWVGTALTLVVTAVGYDGTSVTVVESAPVTVQPLALIAPRVTTLPRVGSPLAASAPRWLGAHSETIEWLTSSSPRGPWVLQPGIEVQVPAQLVGAYVCVRARARNQGGETEILSAAVGPVPAPSAGNAPSASIRESMFARARRGTR